jgi:hypothetical protein
MAKAEVMKGWPIFYLNDAKESKEEDSKGGGDAGVANLLPERHEGEQGRGWRRRR